MASDDEQAAKKPATNGPGAWLSNRAGLIILVVIAAIVALKLMSSWIKWMLIAMVVAAIVYLVKGALRRES
jgi:O-antigen ligase